MYFTFGSLAGLISKFKNMNCLVINRNKIFPIEFNHFFKIVIDELKLRELSLINDGIFTRFMIELLEGGNNELLDTLTLSYHTDNSDLCSVSPLAQFKSLQKLFLPHETLNVSHCSYIGSLFHPDNCLQLISVLKNNNYKKITFTFTVYSANVVFDLQNICSYLEESITPHQIERITKLFVTKFNHELNIMDKIIQLHSLPNLLALHWYYLDYECFFRVLSMTKRLKFLSVNFRMFINALNCVHFTIKIFPELLILEIFLSNDHNGDSNLFASFLRLNPSIKVFRIQLSSQSIYEAICASNSDQYQLSIEELSVESLLFNQISIFLFSLLQMPKLKRLLVSYRSDKKEQISFPTAEFNLLRIEQLTIRPRCANCSITNLLLSLIPNVPLLSVLTI